MGMYGPDTDDLILMGLTVLIAVWIPAFLAGFAPWYAYHERKKIRRVISILISPVAIVWTIMIALKIYQEYWLANVRHQYLQSIILMYLGFFIPPIIAFFLVRRHILKKEATENTLPNHPQKSALQSPASHQPQSQAKT